MFKAAAPEYRKAKVQKGIAILNTTTGLYEVVIQRPRQRWCNHIQEYTLTELQTLATTQGTTFTGAGTYELHYFDNDEGGWGWGQMNQVQMAGVKTEKTDTATLTITITGTNDEPVATNDSVSITETGGNTTGETATAGSGLNVLSNDTEIDTDANSPNDNITVIGVAAGTGSTPTTGAASTITGTYGNLILNANGTYTYSLVDSRVDALNGGQAAVDVFTYTIIDGTATSVATLTVNVTGSNDNPVAAKDTASITETGGPVLSESATVSDTIAINDTDVDAEDHTTPNTADFASTSVNVVGVAPAVLAL